MEEKPGDEIRDEIRWVRLESAGEGLEITLNTLPDREREVAMLWDRDIQWGEINQEGSVPTLIIFPRSDGQPWTFALDDFVMLLKEARESLLDSN